MKPKFFKVDSPLFNQKYQNVYAFEMMAFKNEYSHSIDKRYFIQIKLNKIWEFICLLNSKTGSLNQYISEWKNRMLLDGRLTSLDLINEYCMNYKKNTRTTIEQLAEITALYDLYDVIQNKEFILNKAKKQHTPKQNPTKLITISPEIIDSLFTNLQMYFDSKDHNDLHSLLRGENTENKPIFQSNANQFVELMRRLKYNSLIVDNYHEIENWISNNFLYLNRQKLICTFKKTSIHPILYGTDRFQPSKTKRILNLDFIPYKTNRQIKRYSKLEKQL